MASSVSPYGPSEFAAEFNVSRETLTRLESYAALLIKWNKAINLVSPKSLDTLWERHFRDSAQLCDLIATETKQILDLGSGGGFPGLVLAIMLAPRGTHIEMVESDTRKALFLQTVIRETDLGDTASVTAERVEALAPRTPDVITARAFAPLPALLDYVAPHGQRNGAAKTICLFLKGQSWQDELTDAQKAWTIAVETIPSLTASTGVVLKIRKFNRV